MLNVAYVRVWTDNQVEYSPAAQTQRAKDFARLHDLGPGDRDGRRGMVRWTLDRPEMQRLIGHSRTARSPTSWCGASTASPVTPATRQLTRLMERHCVQLHSVAEGRPS